MNHPRPTTAARTTTAVTTHAPVELVPERFQALTDAVVGAAGADPRFLGVLVAGSVASGTADEHSDLDLVLVCDDDHHPAVLAHAREFAGGFGPLLVAFTGEHVGEPRVLICLYGPPLAHVDLKFIAEAGLDDRVEDGAVLWQRDGRIDEALRKGSARWPVTDPQWVEDRFWVWVHYVAVKVARGELFEAVDGLATIRAAALAPLATAGRTTQPAGVRRLEVLAPEHRAAFAATVARPDATECLAALDAAVNLYRRLRTPGSVHVNAGAEKAVVEFLAAAQARR